MSLTYSFDVNGRSYTIDNTAYNDGKATDVFFEVRKCPKCRRINSPNARKCNKCDSELGDDSIFIGTRIKRTGLGLWIGSGIWAVITAILTLIAGGKLLLGFIPTVLLLGGCMYFGKMIAGYKIIINDQASADYKEYRRTKALKESIREISDPDEIKKYALTRKCPFCNQLTEDDSKYCSICGKRLMDQLLKEIDTAVDSQDERSEYQKIVDVYGDDTEELINYWAILYGFKLEQDKIGPSFYSQMREGLLKNIKEEKGADFCEKIINIENYLDQEKLAKEVDVVNGIESGKYHVRLKNNNIQILVNNSDT